jgi:hypothetical protein
MTRFTPPIEQKARNSSRIGHLPSLFLVCAYLLGYKRWDNMNKGVKWAGAMFSGIPDVLVRSE